MWQPHAGHLCHALQKLIVQYSEGCSINKENTLLCPFKRTFLQTLIFVNGDTKSLDNERFL